MSLSRTSVTSETTFEDILDIIGWGCYQRISFIVCGFSAFVQAFATSSVFYVLPLSICDHRISPEDIAIPFSSYFCGMAFGGYILGCFTDCAGRRAIVNTGLVMIFIGTMGCCFSTSTPMLIISSLIIGFGANSVTTSGKILLAEVAPKSTRARILVLLDVFWTFGYILGIVTYMYMTPSAIKEQHTGTKNMRLKSWRVIMATGGIACIAQTTLTGLLCRSTRFLMAMHRLNEASESLRHMYALNKSKPMSEFEISNLDSIIDTTPLTTLPMLCLDILPHITEIVWQLTASVMKKHLHLTLKCTVVYSLICFEIAVYNIFLAETLKMCAKQNDCFIGYKSFVQVEFNHGKCITTKQLPYFSLLQMSCAMLLGYIALALIIDLLRRPALLSLLSFLATVCYSVLASTQILGLCYAAKYVLVAVICSAKSVLDIALIEMFPTAVRGTANGMVKFIGQMTWCTVILFLWANCQMLFIIQGCLMLACAIATWSLPDYRGKPMQEKL